MRKYLNALEQLVQILTTDLPEDKETSMTFAQQLRQQGREIERYEVAKSLLAEGISF